jgi:hypothetical protein
MTDFPYEMIEELQVAASHMVVRHDNNEKAMDVCMTFDLQCFWWWSEEL